VSRIAHNISFNIGIKYIRLSGYSLMLKFIFSFFHNRSSPLLRVVRIFFFLRNVSLRAAHRPTAVTLTCFSLEDSESQKEIDLNKIVGLVQMSRIRS